MKNPFKKKSNSAKETIKNIATLTTALTARANECTTVDQYIATVRLPLNQAIVEAMLGCKIDRADKKVKFNKKLPNTEQIAEVARLVDGFIQATELPSLKRIATLDQQVQNPAPQPQSGNDMEMPPEQVEIGTVNVSFQGMPQRVMLMEKPTEKKLKKQVFSAFLGGFMLNGTDCVTLASMGEKARSTANRNKMLVVGGIVILITGLTIAGVMFYKSKHKKNKDGSETAEIEIDGESTEIDIPAAETMGDEVDAPQVEIE